MGMRYHKIDLTPTHQFSHSSLHRIHATYQSVGFSLELCDFLNSNLGLYWAARGDSGYLTTSSRWDNGFSNWLLLQQ